MSEDRDPGARGHANGDGEADTRSGFVALIGATNAGKSTLLNALVGEKVSIVTHKVQTTRANVRGIREHAIARGEAAGTRAQIVFVDTPGIFQPRRRLDRAMVDAAWAGAKDADLVSLIVDVERGLSETGAAILARLGDVRLPRVLLLNKIDRVEPERLLALAAEANAACPFDATFMISALHGDGLTDYLDHLARTLPPGPFLYPAGETSDQDPRVAAAETTREKVYLRLHQELPYNVHVETEEWEERRDGSVRIGQAVYVPREGHRKIVLGHKGKTIRQIGQAAREDIAERLGRPVHLFLFVKVRPWLDDPERYREMGLDFSR